MIVELVFFQVHFVFFTVILCPLCQTEWNSFSPQIVNVYFVWSCLTKSNFLKLASISSQQRWVWVIAWDSILKKQFFDRKLGAHSIEGFRWVEQSSLVPTVLLATATLSMPFLMEIFFGESGVIQLLYFELLSSTKWASFRKNHWFNFSDGGRRWEVHRLLIGRKKRLLSCPTLNQFNSFANE